MKKKLLTLLFVSILIFILLGIGGVIPVIHEFNIELIKKIIALFN